MTRKQIVILGGGTGGTMTANRLRRRFDADEAEIHVVDRDDRHVYQPGLLFVPFGLAQRRRDRAAAPAPAARRRRLPRERGRGGLGSSATRCCSTTAPCSPYDVLVVASGVRLQPEETEGMTGPGWNERVFTFYDARGRRGAATARSSASTAAGWS